MKEFSYLDYWTEYSCEGSLTKEMGREWCFSYVFNNVRNNSKVKYDVILYKGTDYSKEKHASNACLLSKRELKNHLRILKSLYPIQFTVKDHTKRGNYERIIVTMELENVPATFHRYALTWLRYTYEFPYNMLLKDAYTLKKDPIFRFESIANLFNLTIGCYCHEPRDIHQIPKNRVSKRMKLADLKEKIKKVKRLNDIYLKLKNKDKMVPEEIKGFSVNDIEYWDSGFDERKPIYMNVYKQMVK